MDLALQHASRQKKRTSPTRGSPLHFTYRQDLPGTQAWSCPMAKGSLCQMSAALQLPKP